MGEILDLHRKYRPKTLQEVIGNAPVKTAISTFLRSEHKPQVILLKGISGCGKTSLARLICKNYCCENPNPDGTACGVCDTCIDFANYIETGDSSNIINLTEVDVTDDNGKKAVEDLIDDMYAFRLTGSWKCYIFDECHLMTQAAQARLLKTIEEPPENVLICLCTTNPEKLLNTITSRCHYQFNIKKPTRDEIIAHLQSICLQEGISADRKALSLIANKGMMIPRDCLILLQQVICQCKKVEYDSTAECLELIADKYYFTFYKLLTAEQISVYEYLSLIHEISTKLDLDDFIDGLINFTARGIYVYNNVPVDGLDASELPAYSKLFAQFQPREIVYMLNYLTALRNDKDAEIKLMKLGYTGIQGSDALSSSLDDLSELASVSSLTTSAASDSQAGSEAFQERTTVTDEDRKEIVKSETAPVELNNILDMFGGVRVNI